MENKVLSIRDTKKKLGLIILLIVLLTAVTAELILSAAHSGKGDIKESFYRLVSYDPRKGLLSFTIPRNLPKGYKFYLHVSGRMFMGDKTTGMSFHAFDKESQSYTWESGKTYTYPVSSDNLDFIMLDFGLLDNSNNQLLYEYIIHIEADGKKTINKYLL